MIQYIKYLAVALVFCAILAIGMLIADRSTETLLNGEYTATENIP